MKSEILVPRGFFVTSAATPPKGTFKNLSSSGFRIQSCGQGSANTMSKMQHKKTPHFLSFKELYSSFITILIF